MAAVRHLPNLICLLRIALVWPIVLALQAGDYRRALLFFAIAAVSDALDGYLAKRFNWTSRLGHFLDPFADKLLLVSVFITCAWVGLVPVWLATLAVGRDVMIRVGAIIFRLWLGPLHGRPTIVSKLNTGFQIACLIAIILFKAYGFPPHELFAALAVVTAITTVLSGGDYLLQFIRRGWSPA